MLHQPFSAAAKILLKPNVDAGDMELAIADDYAPRMVDVFTGTLLQQRFGILTRIGSGLEIWATQAAAVDCVMNPIVFPDRSKNTVLDVI